MPYKYAVECVLDKMAASKTYNGKKYHDGLPLEHWLRHGNKINGNPRTMLFIETVFRDLLANGEKYIMNKKYMIDTYRKICVDTDDTKI